MTSGFYMSLEDFVMMAKKLPLLEQLVFPKGFIKEGSLAALVDHCPHHRLFHADGCSTYGPIDRTLLARLEDRIEDLRLPRRAR